MTSRTHKAIAFAALMTASVYFPTQKINGFTLVTALIANIIGSMLPDLDQATNQLWDLLPGGNFVGRLLRRLFIAHRTLSHSLLGVFLVYKFLNWLLPNVLNSTVIDSQLIFTSLMIGYLSHLAADSLTEEGIPLLFPLKIKFGFPPIKSWRIKTGRWFEKIIIFPATIIFTIWITAANYRYFWSVFVNLYQP